MRKLSRAQLIAVLIGLFVLASLAVAIAAGSGGLGGGEDEFRVDSAEPDSVGSSPEEITGETAGESLPATVAPAEPNPGELSTDARLPRPGSSSSSGPDTPVSSDETPGSQRTAISDPPSAFSGIRNFEDCAAAGYPVAESYPEQCRTPDGRLFVRVID